MKKIPSKLDTALCSLRRNWMKSHLMVNFICMLSVTLAEIVVFIVFCLIGEIEGWEGNYFLHYLLYPFVLNLAALILQIIMYKSESISDTIKMYVLTAGLALSCFIIVVVHSSYQSLSFVMVIPIVVSVIYGTRRLTGITSALCAILEFLHVFVITYDPSKISPFSDINVLIQYCVSFVAQASLIFVCFKILMFEKERIEVTTRQEEERRMLQEEARTDLLTGLYNRAALMTCCREILTEEDKSSSYVFVMADMDNFKQVNDTKGHTVGDEHLTLMGRLISKYCNGGLAFRYGGDEFCMIYKNIPSAIVKKDCMDLQTEFLTTISDDIKALGVSISFGIAESPSDTIPSTLIKEADVQLYLAKKSKRCIRSANESAT